jgi:hypothetical protein
MPTRITMLFEVTTSPQNRSTAVARTGGWSESFWSASDPSALVNFRTFLGGARTILLPLAASLVGFRVSSYTIAGNRLVPGTSQTAKIFGPGSPSFTVDAPQISLELNGQGVGVLNTNKFRIGCIPDEVVQQGEFAPTPFFAAALTNYQQVLLGVTPAGNFAPLGFIGRDLTQPSVRIVGIAANVVTTFGPVPGIVNGSTFIRFHRAYDVDGLPIKGTYLVTAGAGTNALTLTGFTGQTMTKPSGLVRLDALAFQAFQFTTVGATVVKKVGRPFVGYRGRRSNQTAP